MAIRSALLSGFEKTSELLQRTAMRRIPGVGRVHHLLYSLLNGLLWLWPGLGRGKKVLEIQGSKMYIDVHDKDPSMRCTFRAYALRHIHEEHTTELFKKVIREGDVVVDLGANLGYFTLLAAKLIGKRGRVYSFEPEPRNYHYLLKNIELNGYDNVSAMQKAVSDRSGKVKLYVCAYDSGHHTINQYEGIKAYNPNFAGDKKDFVEVATVTLDEFFEGMKQPISVIKMDVEGAEMLALSGMDRVVRENEDIKMFVEFFPLLIREMGGSPEEFIRRLLEDYHLSVFVIKGDYSVPGYAPNEGYPRINSVDELMDLCEEKMDHVNLFVKRGEDMLVRSL
jgi:FkbM family methyltransferase